MISANFHCTIYCIVCTSFAATIIQTGWYRNSILELRLLFYNFLFCLSPFYSFMLCLSSFILFICLSYIDVHSRTCMCERECVCEREREKTDMHIRPGKVWKKDNGSFTLGILFARPRLLTLRDSLHCAASRYTTLQNAAQ